MKKMVSTILIAGLSAIWSTSVVEARGNTPCSGKKGGVARCQGGKFVCKDGSISSSKKICTRQ